MALTLELIQNPDTHEMPKTQGEAAENAEKQIKNGGAEYGTMFERAVKANAQMNEIERQQAAVTVEILKNIDGVKKRLTSVLNMDPAAVELQYKRGFEAKEVTSFKDHQKKAAAYRAIVSDLHAKTDTKVTPNEWIVQAKEELANNDLPAPDENYILTNFEKEVSELLMKPYDPVAHNTLRDQVVAKIESEPGFALRKDRGDVLIRINDGFFWALEFLSGRQTHGTNMLSKDAIEGMIGGVLDETEAKEVFAGNFNSIKGLPSGSVKLHVMDAQYTFYHEEGQELPADILNELKKDPALTRRVLFVHYKTDEDVLKLFKDMSAGERLVVQRKDNGGSISIEGCSGEDCSIKIEPADISHDDFMASPMKYLDHEFDMPVHIVA